MADNQNKNDRTVDGPTVYGPNTGQYIAPPAAHQSDEPTVADPGSEGRGGGDPTAPANEPPTSNAGEEPTTPTNNQDEPTIAVGDDEPTVNQRTAAAASYQAVDPVGGEDEVTGAVGGDEPTTTGPTVGGWPFDQFEPPPPEELIWRAEAPPPEPPVATRSPAYYVSLGAAVVLVVALVALAVVVTVMRPQREVVGAATAGDVPQITASNVPSPTTGASTSPPSGPLAELATHPLSSLSTRMADATCALPRFDPADDRQAAFYAAAKVCADDAWRATLSAAGLDGTVTVVTLTGPAQTQSCGELAPTSPATECDGTVYLTPAHLRDTEQNGRFPGRYLGVFLREYARALQSTTGIDELVAAVRTGAAEDLDERLAQQATCLAGVISGSMAGRGAIDSNITGEIRDRLSTKDAPPDAKAWLDKGFQQRTPAACNTWVN
jgi:hypothetical protein